MSLPGFLAETSLYRTRTNFRPTGSRGSLLPAGVVVPQLPVSTGCGSCTPITWPDGTSTGACRQGCCNWFGCWTESCACGGGSGVFHGRLGAVFGGARTAKF